MFQSYPPLGTCPDYSHNAKTHVGQCCQGDTMRPLPSFPALGIDNSSIVDYKSAIKLSRLQLDSAQLTLEQKLPGLVDNVD